jgi:hypothetical protein
LIIAALKGIFTSEDMLLMDLLSKNGFEKDTMEKLAQNINGPPSLLPGAFFTRAD